MCDFLEIILGDSEILNVSPFLITVVSGITNIKKRKKMRKRQMMKPLLYHVSRPREFAVSFPRKLEQGSRSSLASNIFRYSHSWSWWYLKTKTRILWIEHVLPIYRSSRNVCSICLEFHYHRFPFRDKWSDARCREYFVQKTAFTKKLFIII